MTTMTPTELAAQLDSDPKTVRKFLRSTTPREKQPGRGHRWVLPGNKRELTKLQKRFDEWRAIHTRQPAED